MKYIDQLREMLRKNISMVQVERLQQQFITELKLTSNQIQQLLDGLLTIARMDPDARLRANALRIIELSFEPDVLQAYTQQWVDFVRQDSSWRVRQIAGRLIVAQRLTPDQQDQLIQHLSHESHPSVLLVLGLLLGDAFLEDYQYHAIARWYYERITNSNLPPLDPQVDHAFNLILHWIPDVERHVIVAEVTQDTVTQWSALHALAQQINKMADSHLHRLLKQVAKGQIYADGLDEIFHLFNKISHKCNDALIDHLIEVVPYYPRFTQLLQKNARRLTASQIEKLIYLAETATEPSIQQGIYRVFTHATSQLNREHIYRLLFLLSDPLEESRQILLEALRAHASQLNPEQTRIIARQLQHDTNPSHIFAILQTTPHPLPLAELCPLLVDAPFQDTRERREQVVILLERYLTEVNDALQTGLITQAITATEEWRFQRIILILQGLQSRLRPDDLSRILSILLEDPQNREVSRRMIAVLRALRGDPPPEKIEFLMHTLEHRPVAAIQRVVLDVLQIYARALRPDHLNRLLNRIEFEGDPQRQRTVLTILHIRFSALEAGQLHKIIKAWQGGLFVGALVKDVIRLLRRCSTQLDESHVQVLFRMYVEAVDASYLRDLFNLLQMHTAKLAPHNLEYLIQAMKANDDPQPVRLLQRAVEQLKPEHIEQLIQIAESNASAFARQNAVALLGRHGNLNAIQALAKIRRHERLRHPFKASELEEAAFEALYAIYLQHPDAFEVA